MTPTNPQQLVWLAAAAKVDYTYYFIENELDLLRAASIDRGVPTYAICDARDLKRQKIPKGFSCYANSNTAVVICGSHLKEIADEVQIHKLNLDAANGLNLTNLQKEVLAQLPFKHNDARQLELLIAAYSEYPTTLYHVLKTPDAQIPSNNSTEKAFVDYLSDLSSDSNCQLWLTMNTTTGMRLCRGHFNFLNWLSAGEDRGKLRSLAPLISPFIDAFNQTSKVEYLRLFGRWCRQANTAWAQKGQMGVGRYKLGYYCSFSATSLIKWQELVKLLP